MDEETKFILESLGIEPDDPRIGEAREQWARAMQQARRKVAQEIEFVSAAAHDPQEACVAFAAFMRDKSNADVHRELQTFRWFRRALSTDAVE